MLVLELVRVPARVHVHVQRTGWLRRLEASCAHTPTLPHQKDYAYAGACAGVDALLRFVVCLATVPTALAYTTCNMHLYGSCRFGSRNSSTVLHHRVGGPWSAAVLCFG